MKKITTITLLTAMILALVTSCNQAQPQDKSATEENKTNPSSVGWVIRDNTIVTEPVSTTQDEDDYYDDEEDDDDPVLAVPGDGIPDSGRAKYTDSYNVFMSFIDEYEKANPGTKYRFTADNDERVDGPFWVLITYSSGKGNKAYCCDGNKVIDYEIEDWEMIEKPKKGLSYEAIKSIPTLFETGWDLRIETSIEDGYYFGDIIAYSEDGKYLLFNYGKGSYIKIKDAKKLKTGDKVKFEGSNEIYTVDKGSSGLDSSFDDEWFYLGDDYLPEEMSEKYLMLMGPNDNPEYSDMGTALLPISEDVEIIDKFDSYYSTWEIDGYRESHNKAGNPFLDSAYYIGNSFIEGEFALWSNGYTSGEAFLYPIVVKDGKIVKIQLEWR